MDLYNIEDEEYCEYLKGLCLTGLPIPFYNKHLHHIKVKDVFTMSEEVYNSLVNPFRLNSDALLGKPPIGEERFLLDILSTDDIQIDYCIEFLKIVFETNNVKLNYMPNDDKPDEVHKEIVIDDILWLDKIKFEQLSEIIQKMCHLKKVTENDINKDKKEKKLTYEQIMNIKDRREREYQLAIYNKNKKEDSKNKKALSLYSVFNYVCHASNSVDYEKPLSFNLYQLYNTYIILNKAEKYRYDMRLLSSGMLSDVKKMDTRGFNERIIDE